MGRPPGSKKDPFDALDTDEKDKLAAMAPDDIKGYIARVAMDQENLLKARDEDQDLQEKKEAASEAGAIYKEGSKRNRLRTKYAMRCLGDKGGDINPDGETSNLN
jgi:hypothetical protein